MTAANRYMIVADGAGDDMTAATDSGKKSYEPDPKPVAKPKKGKRGK